MYKVCESCKSYRASGDLSMCLACRGCKGTGVVRDPATRVCNGCGGGLCPRGTSVPHGLVDAVVEGGYSSEHLFDCTSYRFSLCEKCLREMFDRFAVPPDVFGDAGLSSSYARDSESYRLMVWRESGDQRAKLATGLCSASPECRSLGEWRVFYSGHMTDLSVCRAHRSVQARNGRFAPAGPLSDIPGEKSDRTLAQKMKLADEYLKAVVLGDGLATHFMYLGECVEDVVGKEGAGTGGVWVPAGTPPVPSVLRLKAFSLPSGTLFVGPSGVVRDLALAAHIRPDPELCDLYPDLYGDDLSVGD